MPQSEAPSGGAKPNSERPIPSRASVATDWQLFVDHVEDYAIFMLDTDGRVATWNRGAERIKQYAASEIIGRHFSEFYTDEDLASEKPARELVEARALGRVEDEGWRVRKDGSTFWANVVITALFNPDGTLRGYAKITRDLTLRRAANEELRRSEERFRLLIESVSDYAMYMLDPSGIVTTWNLGAEKLKGYKPSEIIGKNFSVFFREEDVRAGKPVTELAVALSDGRFEEEGVRIRKDGSEFWANVTLTPVRDASGTLLGFAKVTRDLTTRIAAERTAHELVREQAARAAAESAEARIREAARRAEDAARRAEEASRVKDEFLATVSHELRTPLNAIVGWSALLRGRSQEESVRKGLEVIHRNALTQGRIIEDILDVSRIITGKLRLDLKQTDLATIVREAIDVVRPAAAAKDLNIELSLPERDCLLVADAERIRQVVWNLVSNAAKFTESGGHIYVSLEARVDALVLSVRDTGHGIAPEFLPLVFDRFQQADSSMTRRVGGLGLGLAIVRHLVELHGGDVEAHSPGLGLGATFRVALPRQATAQPADETSQSQRPPPEVDAKQLAKALSGRRVLVVEDDDDARELLSSVLSSAGAEVATASSAKSGFAAVQSFRPDVLVSDIGMPDEDGYSFMQRVSRLAPAEGGSVPSIALTAYTRSEDRAKALAMGFTNHIGKPVSPNELIAAVAKLALPPRG
jgi:PAS domain S-box-containing protein